MTTSAQRSNASPRVLRGLLRTLRQRGRLRAARPIRLPSGCTKVTSGRRQISNLVPSAMAESCYWLPRKVNLCSLRGAGLTRPPAAAHVAGASEAAPEGPAEQRSSAGRWWFIVLTMVLLPTLERVRRFTGTPASPARWCTRSTSRSGWAFSAPCSPPRAGHTWPLHGGLLAGGMAAPARPRLRERVTTLVCAFLAYASLDMLLLGQGSRRHLAGGVPEWWFEIVMPVGFAVMSVRGALKAPTAERKCSAGCDRAVVPVRHLALRAAGGPGSSPCPTDRRCSTDTPAALAWPGAILLFAAFLLGAPVFVVMAGFALLLFYLAELRWPRSRRRRFVWWSRRRFRHSAAHGRGLRAR